MFAIIKWGLWQRRWFIFWWVLGIVVFIAINLSVYPTFKTQSAQYNQVFSQMPASMKELFSDTGDFFSPIGYMSSQVYYLMLPLLFSALSIGLGSSLLAKEEQAGTLELILSRPISRSRVLLGKALCGLAVLGGIGAITALSVVILASITGFDISIIRLVLATGMSLLLATLFGAIAFMLTAVGRSARTAAIGISTLIALGGYIISSLDGTVKWLRWPAKLFPFHYYKPSEILGGTATWYAAAIFALVIIGLTILSVVAFRRRDIG